MGLRVWCQFLIICIEERCAWSATMASLKMPLCLVFGVFVIIIFVWPYTGGRILLSD